MTRIDFNKILSSLEALSPTVGFAGSWASRSQALFPVYDTGRTPLPVLWGQVCPSDA